MNGQNKSSKIKRCKGKTIDGDACYKRAEVDGYCMLHFFKKNNIKFKNSNQRKELKELNYYQL